jgi:hypothetical protein
MGPHADFNQTLRGDLPPKNRDKFPHVYAMQEETRRLYTKGMPNFNHHKTGDSNGGVLLLDLYQIFHAANAVSAARNVQLKKGVTLFQDIWRRATNSLSNDQIHTVVLTTDDASRVPNIKNKEQKRRKTKRRNDPYTHTMMHIVEDGYITGTCSTPQPIDGMKLMATRGGMRNLWKYFDSKISSMPIPSGKRVIFDYDRKGPVEYTTLDRIPQRRVMDECVHEYGEADMSMIYWTTYFSTRATSVIVRSIDADVIPMFGKYMDKYADVCPDYVFWVFGKANDPVCVELHMLYEVITKYFGHMNHFFASVILCKTDFHEAQAFTYGMGVHKVMETMINYKDELMPYTDLYDRGTMFFETYIRATIRALGNEKNWMCLDCDAWKLGNCLKKAQAKRNKNAKRKSRIPFPEVKAHTCDECSAHAETHECFGLDSYMANWAYWEHEWADNERDVPEPMQIDRSCILIDRKIHHVVKTAKNEKKRKRDQAKEEKKRKKAQLAEEKKVKTANKKRVLAKLTAKQVADKKSRFFASAEKKKKTTKKKPVAKKKKKPVAKRKRSTTTKKKRISTRKKKRVDPLDEYHQSLTGSSRVTVVCANSNLTDAQLENKWIREEGMLMSDEL